MDCCKNARSIGMAVYGLILLAVGILILVKVPGWGNWLAGYPAQLLKMPFPPEAAPVAGGLAGAFGPLLAQVGSWVRIVAYTIGSLVTLAGIGVTGMGCMMMRKGQP